MGSKWAERVSAGLCRDCGASRADSGVGHTTVRCAPCAQKARERSQKWRAAKTGADRDADKARRRALYQERADAGRCARCGGERDRDAREAAWVDCSDCHAADGGRAAEYRHRRRLEAPWADLRQGRPLPVGRAVQGVNGEKQVTVELDPEARRVLEEMLRRDTEEQEERERRRREWSPPEPVETSFRVSRLVRAAIRRWAERSCPPRAHRPFWTDKDEWQRRTLAREEYERQRAEDPDDGCVLVPPRSRYRLLPAVFRIGLWLDAECLALVERDADLHYRGNRSEAIRAMIVAARPRWLVATAGRQKGEWADARRRPTRRYARFCDTAPEDDPWHDPWNEDQGGVSGVGVAVRRAVD